MCVSFSLACFSLALHPIFESMLCDFIFGCFSSNCFFFSLVRVAVILLSNGTHIYAFEIDVKCDWKLHAIEIMFFALKTRIFEGKLKHPLCFAIE